VKQGIHGISFFKKKKTGTHWKTERSTNIGDMLLFSCTAAIHNSVNMSRAKGKKSKSKEMQLNSLRSTATFETFKEKVTEMLSDYLER